MLKIDRKKRNAIVLLILIILMLFLVNSAKIIDQPQESRSDPKEKLQVAVDKSRDETGNLSAKDLEDNLKEQTNDFKILNPNTNTFPIYTIIEGKGFNVSQDGKVEEGIKEGPISVENITGNATNNNIIDNKINEEQQDTEMKDVIYSKTYNGVTISKSQYGELGVKGIATSDIFIKISSQIDMSNNISAFLDWYKVDGVLMSEEKRLSETITCTRNGNISGVLDFAMRTVDNEEIGTLKIANNQLNREVYIGEDIIANYLYIAKGTEIDDYRFKVDVTEEKFNIYDLNLLKLNTETKEYNGVKLQTNTDGSIVLNGTSEGELYMKITNGIYMTSDADENRNIFKNEPTILNNNDWANLYAGYVSGDFMASSESKEFNLCLVYDDGTIASSCKFNSDIYNISDIMKRNVNGLCLYCPKGVIFNNFRIKPILVK